MTSEIILASLFLAALVFVYFVIRLYSEIIRQLTTIISDLKAFSMGVPQPRVEPQAVILPDVDEDFGILRTSIEPEVPEEDEEDL
ncbi:hypothetical protein KKF61_07585 [Patescibacteria group bacterium]|nr:hypothetical protein [Patescibacteria group bacterium]